MKKLFLLIVFAFSCFNLTKASVAADSIPIIAIFGLDEMNGIIDISLTLQESTNVHISISSSNGQYTKTIMDKKIGTGEQHFKVAPPQRGLYNIQVILNGRIYSKKNKS